MKESWAKNSIKEYLRQHFGLNNYTMTPEILEQLSTFFDQPQNNLPLSSIISAITIGETFFLRHPEQFSWLAREWLPSFLMQNHKNKNIRVLCAGCATGEEPYSLMGMLRPRLPDKTWDIEIIAVDINKRFLDFAQVGKYSLWSLREDLSRKQNWLYIKDKSVEVAQWVKKGVIFLQHNLLKPFLPVYAFDLVLIRNTLIYFHSQAIQTVWNNIISVLKPGGVVLLSPCDPHPTSQLLESKWTKGGCIFVKKQSSFPESKKVPVLEEKNNESVLEIKQEDYFPAPKQNIKILSIESYILKALTAQEQGQYKAALTNARSAVFLSQSAIYPVFIMACTLEQQGKLEQAQQRYNWVEDQLSSRKELSLLKFSENLTVKQLMDILNARKANKLEKHTKTT